MQRAVLGNDITFAQYARRKRRRRCFTLLTNFAIPTNFHSCDRGLASALASRAVGCNRSAQAAAISFGKSMTVYEEYLEIVHAA